MAICIIEENCTGCGQCFLSCPADAIKMLPVFLSEIDPDVCTECLTCLDYCPSQAIKEE